MEQITLTLIFYGSLKNFFGEKMHVQVSKGTDLLQLINQLKEQQTIASDVLNSSRLAINAEFVPLESKLSENAEVIIMPPFSGG